MGKRRVISIGIAGAIALGSISFGEVGYGNGHASTEIVENSTEASYYVYQEEASLGLFKSKDEAVNEAKKWSNSVVEHEGKAVWRFGDHLYRVKQGNTVLGLFSSREVAVKEAKKWSNSAVEHEGETVWQFGDHLYRVKQGSAVLGLFSGREVAIKEAKKWSNSEVSKDGIITWNWSLDIDSPAAVLIDRETGEVLYEKNMDQKRAIASTSKIMTYVLTMEAVESGKISLSDRVSVSYRAASTGGSSYRLKAGDVLTVKELLESLMILSANDSAVVLGEYVSGSVESFAWKMNQKSKEIGLNSAHFINPNGLPLADDSQNKMTAKDLALLSKYAIDEYGDHLIPITSKPAFVGSYKSFYGKSTNAFVDSGLFVDGLKTGYTRSAGVCIVSTAKLRGDEDNRIIAVVLGNSSSRGVYSDARKLVTYGQNNF